MKKCYYCFNDFDSELQACPICGKKWNNKPKEVFHLRPGVVLQDRYLIGNGIGSGGFGIVYCAYDLKLQVRVAIKEFMLTRIMTREEGKQEVLVFNRPEAKREFEYRKARFLLEAKTMAKFGEHDNIPIVYSFFELNNTAYIVMELLQGELLNAYMNKRKDEPLDINFAKKVINDVGNALILMHKKNIIHKDVAPDNIWICSGENIKIKLLDLGTAKIADAKEEVVDITIKTGYSPREQYSNGNCGPWSDIYALGATLYHMVTAVKPCESNDRVDDNDLLIEPKKLNPLIDDNLNNIILKAMAVNERIRFQDVESMLKAINGDIKTDAPSAYIRKKKIKITAEISAAVVVLAGGGILAAYLANNKGYKVLNNAVIDVWHYNGEDNILEEQSLKTIADEFSSQEEYKNVEINVKSYSDWDSYVSDLKNVYGTDGFPDIFESTGIDDSIFDSVKDEQNLIENVENCSIYSTYSDFYHNYKRIPMSVEFPVAYIINKGKDIDEYSSAFFSDISDFDSRVMCAYEINPGPVYKNFDMTGKEDALSQFAEGKATVLLSTNKYYSEIKKIMSEQQDKKWFAVDMAFPDKDEIVCSFTYEWSIGSEGTKDEITAAEHFASWMLGASAQASLMGGNGYYSVNDIAEEKKLEQSGNDDWKPIKDIKNKFTYKINSN